MVAHEVLLPYLLFVGGAAFWAAVGYLKKRDQAFEPVKFIRTILLAAVLAVAALALGVPTTEDALALLTEAGVFGAVVYGVDALALFLYRRLLRRG